MKLFPLPLLAAALALAGCSTQAPSSATSSVPPSTSTTAVASSEPTTTVPGGSVTTKPAPTEPAPSTGTSKTTSAGTTTPEPGTKPPAPNGATGPAIKTTVNPPATGLGAKKPAKDPAPDVKEKPAPGIKTSDWRPSSLSAVDVAAKVDNAIRTLPGLMGNGLWEGRVPSGHGTGAVESESRDPKHFSFSYLVTSGDPVGRRHRVIRNGGDLAIMDDKGWHALDPNDALFNEAGEQIVSDWPLNFQRFMFAGLVNGKGGFVPYVQAISKGLGAYDVRCEERTVTNEFGKTSDQIRIFAERPAAKAKTLGESSVEMIFVRKWFLPVTVRVVERIPNQAPTDILWSGKWQGNKKFPDTIFKRPKP